MDKRMKNLIHQVGLSFLFKILGIGCSFLLIPLTLHYLGEEQYGVWMTILTVLSWLSFCDLGIGNGMRNEIIIALAKKQEKTVQEYISSSYICFFGIIIFLCIIVILFFSYIPWIKVFNTSVISNDELYAIMLYVVIAILINLELSLINQILNAYQKSSLTVLNQFLSNFISLILTLLVVRITSNNLLLIAIIYSFSMILSNLIFNMYFFSRHKSFIPNIKFLKIDKIKNVTNLGIKFFIIQIAAMIFFAKDNIIITQVLGPTYVTQYNLVFKIFSVFTLAMSLLTNPLWGGFGEAYVKRDFNWIRYTIKKIQKIIVLLAISIFIIAFFTPKILFIWVGDINCDYSFIFLMAIYTILSLWNNMYAAFINATGCLRFSLYGVYILILINIPLSILLTYIYGLNGTVLATILTMISSAILSPIQYNLIMKKDKLEKNSIIYKLFCK